MTQIEATPAQPDAGKAGAGPVRAIGSASEQSSACNLVTGHLNAAYGQVISNLDLETILRSGNLSTLDARPVAQALARSLFAETSPELVVSCALQCGSSVSKANDLYLSIVRDGWSAVPQWEAAMEVLL